MVSFSRFRGLAFVALWQVAPVVAHEDSTGRVIVHLSGGTGRYETVSSTCDGEILGTDDVGHGTGAVAIEVWPGSKGRLNAFVGMTQTDHISYATIGGMAAAEFRYLGAGAGFTHMEQLGRDEPIPLDSDFASTLVQAAMPLAYLRVGNIDGGHFRIESVAPTGLDRMSGFFRTGLGYNHGQLRGTRAFGGLALCYADCEGADDESAVAFIELSRPISERTDLRIGGIYGPGKRNPEYGLTFGASWMPRATRALEATIEEPPAPPVADSAAPPAPAAP